MVCDGFYEAGAYTQMQAEHYELWHGTARPWEAMRERALAGANT